jgi:hypothetical protein
MDMSNNWPNRPELSAQRLRDLAAAAYLDLGEQRAAALVPHMQMISALLDGLRQIDVGETAPAAPFSARWEE